MNLSVQGQVDSGTFGALSFPHQLITMHKDRKALRQQLRAQRNLLSLQQQKKASLQLCRRIAYQPVFLRSQHIALYLPNDGEIDPTPLLQTAWKLGKRCYLPVVEKKKGQMRFVRYQPNTPMQSNRFGILEPDIAQHGRIPPQALDLVLMPLVGFDEQGGRLGMGGGFYDRTFAYRLNSTAHSSHQKPCLLGLAHQCQQVASLATAEWDVPVNAIVTDHRLILGKEPRMTRNFLIAQ